MVWGGERLFLLATQLLSHCLLVEPSFPFGNKPSPLLCEVLVKPIWFTRKLEQLDTGTKKCFEWINKCSCLITWISRPSLLPALSKTLFWFCDLPCIFSVNSFFLNLSYLFSVACNKGTPANAQRVAGKALYPTTSSVWPALGYRRRPETTPAASLWPLLALQSPMPICGGELGVYAACLNHFPSTPVFADNPYGNCFSCLAQLSNCREEGVINQWTVEDHPQAFPQWGHGKDNIGSDH